MPHALDAFDRVVCINLEERTDRWELAQKAAAPLLRGAKLERFNAIKPDLAENPVHNGRAGCLLSHRRVIENAYEEGLDSVLVFEDDLAFKPEFEHLIQPTLATLGKKSWDLFYLGFTPKAPLLPAGDGLVRTYGGATTHAIAYHRRAMTELIRCLPDETNVLRFLSRYKSVDRYYWQKIAPRMRCYAASPMLVFQRGDFSDIQQADTVSNQEHACKAFERHLVKEVKPMDQVKLQIQRAFNCIRFQIDGTRRVLLKPIKAK
ncbi:MAG: glycosyltransferase family 25 protein [Planctomycetota bacterium]